MPILAPGFAVTCLIVIWLGVVSLVAAPLGLYYATLAAWYTLPVVGLIYAYCFSHRSRATTALAVVVTVVAVLIIGSAIVLPRGSAA